MVCFKLFCVENKLLLARIFYEVNNSIIILLEKKIIVCIFVCKKSISLNVKTLIAHTSNFVWCTN